MAQKTGRAVVKLGANALQSKAGARLQIGGVTREPDMSDAGEVFFQEMIVPSELVCTLIHTAKTDMDVIRAFKDGTIEYRCDTGVVYTISDAFYKSNGNLANGEVEVTFGGAPAIQSGVQTA